MSAATPTLSTLLPMADLSDLADLATGWLEVQTDLVIDMFDRLTNPTATPSCCSSCLSCLDAMDPKSV
jgi:hypothetical protein